MRVVDNVLINISPSNIILTLLLPARFHQDFRLLLATVSTNEYHGDTVSLRKYQYHIELLKKMCQSLYKSKDEFNTPNNGTS